VRLELKLLIMSTLLVFPVVANGQFRPAKCDIQPLWVGKTVRSANLPLIGTFEVDGHSTVRSFRHEATNLIVSVGIIFDEDYSKYKLHRVRIAIRISDKEETEIFEEVDSSEARTQYRKGWNLGVTRNANLDDVVYMYTLRCWDGAGKRPFL
jgi:hypothetical protein